MLIKQIILLFVISFFTSQINHVNSVTIISWNNNATTKNVMTRNNQSDIFELILLHNNDMHGRFDETDEYTNQCEKADKKLNGCFGGFARIANVIRKHRKKAENGGPPVLFLNGGDTYTGTPWFALYKHNISAEFLNMLAPDAVCLGNHEFDYDIVGLIPFLQKLKMPILAANLEYSHIKEMVDIPYLKKSEVLNVRGVEIGIIGYITPETAVLSLEDDVKFNDEIEAINEEATILKNKGVKIIIALGHSGIEKDMEIGSKCPLVDLVVGAHSHTYIGKKQNLEDPYGPYPMVVKQSNGKQVPIVQAYAFTKYLGYLKLKFDSEGNLLKWEGEPILLNSKIPQEPDVVAMLDKYRPGIDALAKEVVGKTMVVLDAHYCKTRECNLGNLITDAMVYEYARNYSDANGYWTDAAIGIMQSGGIRASIHAGTNITQFHLNTVLPFNDKYAHVYLTGRELIEVLEHNVHRHDIALGDGEFLQMSGLRVRYNITKPVGQRVVYAESLCALCHVPEYYPIELDQTYKIIMNEYPFKGGDGYSMLKGKNGTITRLRDIENIVAYIKRKKVLYNEVESRIVFEGMVESNQSQKINKANTVIINSMLMIALSIFLTCAS